MGLATSMAGFFKSGKDAFQMRLALAWLAFAFSTACAEAQESADTLDFSGIVTHTLVEAEYYLGLVDPGEGNGNPLAAQDGAWNEAFERLSRTNLSWSEVPAPVLLNVRVKGTDGLWSAPMRKVIWPQGSQSIQHLIAGSDSLAICPGDSLEIAYNGPDSFTPTWWDESQEETVWESPSMSQWWVMSASDGVETVFDSVYIKVHHPQTIPTMPSGVVLVCPASPSFVIEADGEFGQWQWSLDGSPLGSEGDASVGVVQAGEFQVQAVELVSGCATSSEVVNVTGSPSLQWDCHPDLGGILVVESSATGTGSTYEWTLDGEVLGTAAYLSPAQAGLYTLNLSTPYCTAELSLQVDQPELNACGAGCADLDENGVCDEEELPGCTLDTACNFDPTASVNDGSCQWPLPGQTCEGGCLTDVDGDGICDGQEVAGCTDESADNYNPDAGLSDGSCEHSLSELVQCECFFGDDPGEGAGTSFMADDGHWDEVFERLSADAVALEISGPMMFSTRCMQADGTWGELFQRVVFGNGGVAFPDSTSEGGEGTIPSAASVGIPSLVQGEYFFGVFDPGPGNGTQIAVADNTWDEVMERLIREQLTWNEVASPTVLNLRMKGEHLGQEQWGEVFRKVVWPNGSTGNAQLLSADSVTACVNQSITLTYDGPATHSPLWPGGDTASTWTFEVENAEWVVVTASDGQSTFVDSVYVNPISLPDASTEPEGLLLGCVSQPLVSIEAVETGLMYQWSLNENPLGTTSSVNVTALGSYQLVVTDETTGCQGVSDPIVVFSSPEIEWMCSPELGWTLSLGTLAESGYADVAWTSQGEVMSTDNWLSVHEPGVYSVDVSTPYCNAQASFEVTSDMLQSGCLAGCTDESACNYSEYADEEDGTCEYISCEDACDLDDDGDGVCNEDEIPGCTDHDACNFNALATDDDGSCVLPELGFDCQGVCLDGDMDGVCDVDEIAGCAEVGAPNYNPLATEDDGSCVWLPARVVKIEYFLGEDPGEGMGTQLEPVDGAWDEVLERSLKEGAAWSEMDSISLLSVRSLGSNGVWGVPFRKVIWAPAQDFSSSGNDSTVVEDPDGPSDSVALDSLATLDQAEYFIGIFDPGEGQGVPMAVADGSWDEQVEGLLRSQFLWNFNGGPTIMNIRVKDAQGLWSVPFKKVIWSEGEGSDVNIIAQGDTIAVCAQESVTLDFEGPNTFEPIWFDGSTETSVTFIPEESGPFEVTSTDGVGFLSDTIFVQVLPLPEVSTSPSGVMYGCNGADSFGVEAIADGVSYQWFDGDEPYVTSANFMVTKSGEYAVQVTDSFTGCVSMSEPLVVLDSLTPELVCEPSLGWIVSLGTLAESTETLVTWHHQGDPTPMDTGSYFIPSTTGIFDVVVSNGICADSASVVILESDLAEGCGVVDLAGCTDALSCNYNPFATEDDGSCQNLDVLGVCGGGCEEDLNENGICDDQEVLGCMDCTACNFDGTATVDVGCEYAELGYDCAGMCIWDDDGDGVCDTEEILGCQDEAACNFNAEATDEGLCLYPEEFEDCEGNCLNLDALGTCGGDCAGDEDGNGICDVDEIVGCMDPTACDFNPGATLSDTCAYATFGFDCNGYCLLDSDDDGICDVDELLGCQDDGACNYDESATDPGYCQYPEAGTDCEGECLSDVNGNGICDAVEVLGCMSPSACNFNPAATASLGECYFAPLGYDCYGQCLEDVNQNGICDAFELLIGCTGPECCGPNSIWDPIAQECIANGPLLCGDFTVWDASTQSCVGFDTCPADINEDGDIGISDLLELLAAFGQECEP